MKRWIGVTAAGVALIAVWRLPPSSFAGRGGEVKSAAAIRYQRLSNDFRWTSEALRRVRWSDSLATLVVTSAERGVAVAVPESGGVTEDKVARLADKARSEIASLGAHDSGMIFGFVLQPFSHGRDPDMLVPERDRTESYVGSRDGSDYCLQIRVHEPYLLGRVISLELNDMDRTPPRTGLLGPCRFYLSYGPAGTGVQEWMEAGGVKFAVESGGTRLDTRLRLRRSYLGFSALANNATRAIEADQCLAGNAPACAGLFVDPIAGNPIAARSLEIVRRSPAMSIGGSSPFLAVFRDEDFLLADLEDDFGPEAFARFWTSEKSVPEAFEDAFGVDVGSWIVTWVDSVMGIDEPGPGLPRSASTGGMLAVALLIGIAFVRNRRRRVV